MTIDEAIAHQREVAEKIRTEHNCECNYYDIDIDCVKCAEEHEQLAEWLEELKELREMKETIECNAEALEQQGYNKAIDDFYNALGEDLIWIKERFGDDVYTDLWCDVGTRAEQLKEGVTSGTDNQ